MRSRTPEALCSEIRHKSAQQDRRKLNRNPIKKMKNKMWVLLWYTLERNILWNYPEPQLPKHISLMTIHYKFSMLMLDGNWQKMPFSCLLKSILSSKTQHTIFTMNLSNAQISLKLNIKILSTWLTLKVQYQIAETTSPAWWCMPRKMERKKEGWKLLLITEKNLLDRVVMFIW